MPRLEGLTIRPCSGTATALIDGTAYQVAVDRGVSGFRVVWPDTRQHRPHELRRAERAIIRAADQWFDLAGNWPPPDRGGQA